MPLVSCRPNDWWAPLWRDQWPGKHFSLSSKVAPLLYHFLSQSQRQAIYITTQAYTHKNRFAFELVRPHEWWRHTHLVDWYWTSTSVLERRDWTRVLASFAISWPTRLSCWDGRRLVMKWNRHAVVMGWREHEGEQLISLARADMSRLCVIDNST